MSTVSGSQYGVGLITLLVAASIGVGYYQMFYLPEQLATPDVDEHVLHPVKSTIIEMIVGSASADQQDYYVPKQVILQLCIDYHVIWKNVDESESKDYIFGYMVFKDVSARDFQMRDKQFTRGKSFDTLAPCGPWITSADEVTNPQDLQLVTKINGQNRQDSSTKNMFIKIPSIISELSNVMTLEKGDIIVTGTPDGVAMNNPSTPFLKNGDKIEMEIEKLGKIQNTVKFFDHN